MDRHGHTVLVTGGASGIGLALARRFHDAGHRVVICGRRQDALDAAAAAHPGLVTRRCDVADAAEREALAAWMASEFPAWDVLVNNAGIQRHVRLTDPEPWAATRSELAINVDAPIHLALLALRHFQARGAGTIANVTSGLAFVPLTNVATYSATKAALRAWTLGLRAQLHCTPLRVVEIVPPAVDTDLGGPGLHTFGVNLDAFADDVFARWMAGEDEVAYGMAAERARVWGDAFAAAFRGMNGGVEYR